MNAAHQAAKLKKKTVQKACHLMIWQGKTCRPFVIYPPLPLSYLTPGLPGSLWDFPFVGDVIPTHVFKFLINGFVFLFFSSYARSKIMLDDSFF